MSDTTEWTSFDACTQVRTKGFEIDGTNDPKRGFKSWQPPRPLGVEPRLGRPASRFTGATAEDMPR